MSVLHFVKDFEASLPGKTEKLFTWAVLRTNVSGDVVKI